MKRIIIIFLLIFTSNSLFSGNYLLKISGNVFDANQQIPIQGQVVNIYIPKTGTFSGYSKILETNDQGYLYDVVAIPKDVASSWVEISLEDCTGNIVSYTENFSFANPNTYFSLPICADNIAFCNADFSYLTYTGNNFTYFFSDQSTGNVSVWYWDFGDGSTSDQTNITHKYTNPGVYKVCHGISTGDGACSDTIYETLMVDSTLNYECLVSFEPVYFYGLSAGFQAETESPYPTIYSWDFGDGTTGQGDFVIHTFPAEGTYTVTVNGEDSYSCIDSFSMSIEVSDTLSPCEALFQYEVDSTTPFRILFTDESLGNITSWWWDFGDGNTSEEQHPVHNYNLNGTYAVTLMVIDEEINCNSQITKNVIIDYHPECIADFSVLLDSLSLRMNNYHFTNMSSMQYPGEFIWTFGDEQQMESWHASHIYDQSGTYEVCLEIKDQFGYCSDKLCKEITTPDYWNIGGFMFAGDFPINNPVPHGDTATAYLYKLVSNRLYLYDTMEFAKYGYYYFTSLLCGNYLLKTQINEGSPSFMDYFPGYSPSALKWSDAGLIHVTKDLFDCNTHLWGQATMASGPGEISGRIIFDETNPKSKTFKNRSIDPVNVILYDKDMDAMIYSMTDENGYFIFQQVSYGCYYLFAESTGDFSTPYNICLNESFPGIEDVELEVFTENPNGINEAENTILKKINVFPVPTRATLNISFESTVQDRANLVVLNYAGQVVFENNYGMERGMNSLQIPVENLPSGIYVVKIISPISSEALVSKFIRD